ncbi:MAG: HEAT repeat domain-containing protein [Pirellulaceae bacterium]|nr:hypothetical protein [Planctomycetales bacterium]
MRTEIWSSLRALLSEAAESGAARGAAEELERIAQSSDDELLSLLVMLREFVSPNPAVDEMLERTFSALGQRIASPAAGSRTIDDRLVGELLFLETRLFPQRRSRAMLLRALAESNSETALQALADRLVLQPLPDQASAVTAMAPLFRRENLDWTALFPRLLDTLEFAATAVITLDFTNFLVREHLAIQHPATERSRDLIQLLGALTQRLHGLEERPPQTAEEARRVGQQVNESVGLIISVIDAVALIGDPDAVGKLRQAIELRHRRIRTEAAAALIRLGDAQIGREHLAELAKFPIARLRAIAYADELEVLDAIDDQYRDESARAEAELVCWLADSAQFGFPPRQCELVDQRTQYWPGYEEPVQCFLFRFEYTLDEGVYSNIGLVGPATFAFSADLADLPIDDIYSAFAGWLADHEEIFEIRAEQFTEPLRAECARLERRLRDDGFTQIEPQRLGYFFGDRVLIARAQRQGEPGTAVADAVESAWYPSGRGNRPIGPIEGFSIYKGRKLLRTFNP